MSATATSDAAAVGETARGPELKPVHWWQWILMYPALATAFIGAVPTYREWYQAHRLGLPRAALGYALEQHRLWEKNFNCVRSGSPNTFVTDTKVELEVTPCPTGDILVKVRQPDRHEHYRWLGFDSFLEHQEKALAQGTFPREFGAAIVLAQYYPRPPSGGPAVICQFRGPNGVVVRRLRFPDGRCLEEAVNPYSGEVVGTRPVSCNAPC